MHTLYFFLLLKKINFQNKFKETKILEQNLKFFVILSKNIY